MRTLDATLQAAMDSGDFDPIIRAAILDPDDFSVIEYLEVIYFKINGLDIDIEFYDVSDSFPDTISLERGARIDGVEYTIFSGIYKLQTSYKKSRGRCVCKGSVIEPGSINVLADVSYQTLIDSIMDLGDNLATYLDPGADWLDYQFFADGLRYATGNIYVFFALLKQKYCIHATDNGINSILFFSAADVLAMETQYTLTLSKADTFSIQTLYRQFTWKDENKTLHAPGPAGYVIHNLGYLESTDDPPNIPGLKQEVGETCIVCIPNLKYQTGDCVEFDPEIDGFAPVKSILDVTEIFSAEHRDKTKPAWYMELRPLAYFSNTSGGFVPTSVQYTSAYIDLATYGFNNNLDSSVTNVQLLADYIDDLDILLMSGNLSGLADPATARDNLGLGGMAVIDDAPEDGEFYGRQDGSWTFLTLGGMATIDDAPSDGSTYGRLNGAWAVAGASAPLFLDGTADVIQLRVQAVAAQTARLQTWETSAGAVTLSIKPNGDVFTDRWLAQDSNTVFGCSNLSAGTLAHTGSDEGYYNTAFGALCLQTITKGHSNAAFGYRALYSLTTGYSNIAIGRDALMALTTGSENVALGTGALASFNRATGGGNYALGVSALNALTTGYWNIAIGINTGYNNQTGNSNVYLGYAAGLGASGQSNSGNVFIGESCGYAISTGSNNVGIGLYSTRYLTSGSFNIFLGRRSGFRQTTASNLFIVDSQQDSRANATAEVNNAFLYGSTTIGGYLALNIGTTTANAAKETYRSQAYVSTTSTGASAGFGPATTWYAESSVDGTYRQIGQLEFVWLEATDATRKGQSSWYVYDTAQRLGIRINTTGSASQVGVGSTLDGGGVSYYQFNVNGYQLFVGTDTAQESPIFDICPAFISDTHGTYTSQVAFNMYDADGIYEIMRFEAESSVPQLSFFGNAAVAQQAGCGIPTDLDSCIDAITILREALNNYGLTTVE
jgi:hypothetical protein